jgi:hypothetical protein
VRCARAFSPPRALGFAILSKLLAAIANDAELNG